MARALLSWWPPSALRVKSPCSWDSLSRHLGEKAGKRSGGAAEIELLSGTEDIHPAGSRNTALGREARDGRVPPLFSIIIPKVCILPALLFPNSQTSHLRLYVREIER